jgi:hypothetical protein
MQLRFIVLCCNLQGCRRGDGQASQTSGARCCHRRQSTRLRWRPLQFRAVWIVWRRAKSDVARISARHSPGDGRDTSMDIYFAIIDDIVERRARLKRL